MSDERVAQIEARLQAATNMPTMAVTTTHDCYGVQPPENADLYTTYAVYDPSEDDPPFIEDTFIEWAELWANAKPDIAFLLDQLDPEGSWRFLSNQSQWPAWARQQWQEWYAASSAMKAKEAELAAAVRRAETAEADSARELTSEEWNVVWRDVRDMIIAEQPLLGVYPTDDLANRIVSTLNDEKRLRPPHREAVAKRAES